MLYEVKLKRNHCDILSPGLRHIWQSSFSSNFDWGSHLKQIPLVAVAPTQEMNHFGWLGCLNNLVGLYSQNFAVKSLGLPSPKRKKENYLNCTALQLKKRKKTINKITIKT